MGARGHSLYPYTYLHMVGTWTTWKQPPDRGEQWEKKAGVKMLEEELGTESLTYAFPPTGTSLRKHPYHRSRVM